MCKNGKAYWESLKVYNEARIQEMLQSIPKPIRDVHDELPSEYLNQSLFIYGPVGAGKTFLAYKLMQHYVQQRYLCIFVKMLDLIDEVNGYEKSSKDFYNPYSKYGKQHCLVIIDDIGVSVRAEREKEILFRILDFRSDHKLPTILTSNLNITGIEQVLDGRIASRIQGLCKPVHISGKDRRIASA